MKKFFFFIFLILFASTSFAKDISSIQKLNSSFNFTLMLKDSHTVVAQWKIQPNDYLYRSSIQFTITTPKTARIGHIIFPSPIASSKEFHQKLYTGTLTLNVPLKKIPKNTKQIQLNVSYQGCSIQGFCYPPINQTATLNLNGPFLKLIPTQTSLASMSIVSSEPPVKHILYRQGFSLTTIGFLIFGLLLAFTPCILPMIPALSGLIAGQQKITGLKSFVLSSVYVLSMSITYAIIGLIFGLIGYNLQQILQKPLFTILFSLLFAYFSLSFFGLYKIRFPKHLQEKLENVSNRQHTGTLIGAVIMGCLSTLMPSPSVTPPLLAILGYISTTGNAIYGAFALFWLGIGLGIPLLLISLFGGKLLPKPGPWMKQIQKIIGIILLGMAIWILEYAFLSPFTLLLWAILIIATSVYIGALGAYKTWWQKIRKAVGIIFLTYGILLLIGAAVGHNNPFEPLAFRLKTTNINNYTSIKTIKDVKEQLNFARTQHRPVLVEFYADWCTTCQSMNKKVFGAASLQPILNRLVYLRADVTQHDAAAQALESYFKVSGPPAIIIFDRNQRELKNGRIVGKVSAQDLLSTLSQLVLSSRRKVEKAPLVKTKRRESILP